MLHASTSPGRRCRCGTKRDFRTTGEWALLSLPLTYPLRCCHDIRTWSYCQRALMRIRPSVVAARWREINRRHSGWTSVCLYVVFRRVNDRWTGLRLMKSNDYKSKWEVTGPVSRGLLVPQQNPALSSLSLSVLLTEQPSLSPLLSGLCQSPTCPLWLFTRITCRCLLGLTSARQWWCRR